ncbi:tetratricopeptide repeat protein [Falsiruegeria litorea]|uniref:tetratricopeptide repeat protein n=1 Tax=Falsiruegeria litorea TaxID=1280831 RepID=UPI0013FD5BCB|nr:tetratricopeptide repeat protein [Falsiruegeria litorea]
MDALVQQQEIPQQNHAKLIHAFAQGRYADLHAQLLQLIESFPQAYSLWLLLGNTLLKLKGYPKAELAFGQARKLDPSASARLTGLGDAQRWQGHDEAALGLYDEALEQNPRDLTALKNCGNLLADFGRFAAAIGYFERARVLAPAGRPVPGHICGQCPHDGQ